MISPWHRNRSHQTRTRSRRAQCTREAARTRRGANGLSRSSTRNPPVTPDGPQLPLNGSRPTDSDRTSRAPDSLGVPIFSRVLRGFPEAVRANGSSHGPRNGKRTTRGYARTERPVLGRGPVLDSDQWYCAREDSRRPSTFTLPARASRATRGTSPFS